MRKRWVLQAVLLLLGLGVCTGVHAQSSTVGSISGTVRDAQGNAIPETEVTITEESTGQSRTVKTDGDGYYVATSLPVGIYTVTTSPSGFMCASP